MTKDNIKISYLDENGAEKPGTYSNELKSGVRYLISVNAPSVGSNVLDGFEEVTQVKITFKFGDIIQDIVLDNTAK